MRDLKWLLISSVPAGWVSAPDRARAQILAGDMAERHRLELLRVISLLELEAVLCEGSSGRPFAELARSAREIMARDARLEGRFTITVEPR